MATPSRLRLEPQERLSALLSRCPERWSAHAIAAARALPVDEVASLDLIGWEVLLERIEGALDPVVRRAAPMSARRLRV